eukprot:scaffold311781_cov19-Tisochrysis_lutea.AAC.3
MNKSNGPKLALLTRGRPPHTPHARYMHIELMIESETAPLNKHGSQGCAPTLSPACAVPRAEGVFGSPDAVPPTTSSPTTHVRWGKWLARCLTRTVEWEPLPENPCTVEGEPLPGSPRDPRREAEGKSLPRNLPDPH